MCCNLVVKTRAQQLLQVTLAVTPSGERQTWPPMCSFLHTQNSSLSVSASSQSCIGLIPIWKSIIPHHLQWLCFSHQTPTHTFLKYSRGHLASIWPVHLNSSPTSLPYPVKASYYLELLGECTENYIKIKKNEITIGWVPTMWKLLWHMLSPNFTNNSQVGYHLLSHMFNISHMNNGKAGTQIQCCLNLKFIFFHCNKLSSLEKEIAFSPSKKYLPCDCPEIYWIPIFHSCLFMS